MSQYIWDKASQELVPIAGLANINDTTSSEDTTYSSKKIDASLANIDAIKILGWNVPTECPIQNEVTDNQFIQKVNRVDLGTLTWQFSDGVAYTTISTIKPQTNKLYLNGYTVYNSTVSISSMVDKTIKTSKNSGDYTFYVKDSAITSVSDAKSKLSGKYLFYELNTPIVKNIDDSALVTVDNALTNNSSGYISTSGTKEFSLDNASQYLLVVGASISYIPTWTGAGSLKTIVTDSNLTVSMSGLKVTVTNKSTTSNQYYSLIKLA